MKVSFYKSIAIVTTFALLSALVILPPAQAMEEENKYVSSLTTPFKKEEIALSESEEKQISSWTINDDIDPLLKVMEKSAGGLQAVQKHLAKIFYAFDIFYAFNQFEKDKEINEDLTSLMGLRKNKLNDYGAIV
ncbi:MAG: hypothetical protein A2X70_02605 [Alphaproteobacteria bacterium GWC2_42_16]|nr:MAG: hypothetical protein A2X70_02605 [Alphaproteobacteria bacterium GWC2_42_16]OFW73849.1 MAG: hypothetical protein A2Z80_04265 [Alphaproteobacteria bacterium GWA2_41_27]OFW82192.1 MAG: hypothetical protein A3E50_00305 [Alphaproteobacteria bacterium RIFCSPHIGHO2_12_FULL_42_100]OFW86357.1 MAG: hypothetical protein A2W06_02175 [Alphaproteobacteria bacterium RBG_16_42_14]OFW91287.1 MAG: hypothetical protein A3C41_06450 [Alphaproteobacteria bacterium RIFCSPHIGHO2_02_FULL_42_30]OFX05328.1 MAG: 